MTNIFIINFPEIITVSYNLKNSDQCGGSETFYSNAYPDF